MATGDVTAQRDDGHPAVYHNARYEARIAQLEQQVLNLAERLADQINGTANLARVVWQMSENMKLLVSSPDDFHIDVPENRAH